MRTLALILVLAVSPMSVFAQTCVPERIEYSKWGAPGQAVVPVAKYWTAQANGYEGDPNDFVPSGEVWLIKVAGGATDAPQSLHWMLQIEHHLADGQCCFMIPLYRNQAALAGTPILALERPIILEAGERLSLRVNGLVGTVNKASLLYSGWRFSSVCLPQLLGVAVVTSSGGGSVSLPNFGPMVEAAQATAAALSQAASDLNALSNSVP